MAKEIKTVGVQLVVDPGDVSLDREGRISFSDPRIVQALVAGIPGDMVNLEEATNYFQCGPVNNYQCGKAVATPRGTVSK